MRSHRPPALSPSASSPPARAEAGLEALRSRIVHLGRGRRNGPPRVLPVGVEAIDRYLQGGLACGALHEVVGGGPDVAHGAAAALFAAGLLGRQNGPVLWVLGARDLFAPGLAAAGLHPDRLVVAETGAEAHVLPVAEEAVRHQGLAGVVAETARLSLTASRRLQLAAEASGVPILVIRRWLGREGPDLSGTVATTRWRLTALASAPLAGPGLGPPRWRVDLLRWRGGEPAQWIVEWREDGHEADSEERGDQTGGLRLAADLADRPAPAGPQSRSGAGRALAG